MGIISVFRWTEFGEDSYLDYFMSLEFAIFTHKPQACERLNQIH